MRQMRVGYAATDAAPVADAGRYGCERMMSDFLAEYSDEERRWLLRLAHESIRAAVKGETMPTTKAASAHLQEERGAFVTLHENGELRGCIGLIAAVKPLDET